MRTSSRTLREQYLTTVKPLFAHGLVMQLRAWCTQASAFAEFNNPVNKPKHKMKTLEQQVDGMIPEWVRLFKALKQDIGDDYRASDDPEDNTPGMCVTIGFTPESEDNDASWSYQTGDNSYSGGAYSHPHWAVVSLYRRSNCKELANDCASQIYDAIPA